MKNKLIKISLLALTFCGLATLLPTTAAFAGDTNSENKKECSETICNGNYPDSVKAACGCDKGDTSTTIDQVIPEIINSIILVLGIVAVIFIVIGGIGFMTSSGDANKVKKSKDTVLYACIGLVVCILAYAIANFAIRIIAQH